MKLVASNSTAQDFEPTSVPDGHDELDQLVKFFRLHGIDAGIESLRSEARTIGWRQDTLFEPINGFDEYAVAQAIIDVRRARVSLARVVSRGPL